LEPRLAAAALLQGVGQLVGEEPPRAAVDIVGTDEEAIFATLLPFERHTAELEAAFEKRYGENLRARIVSEMSGSELDYALELLAPEGETKKVEDLLSPQVIERHFAADQDLARKILRDLLAVRGDRLDFSSEAELVDEIRKRLRTSQLMQHATTGPRTATASGAGIRCESSPARPIRS
jgi:hypothetical protein